MLADQVFAARPSAPGVPTGGQEQFSRLSPRGQALVGAVIVTGALALVWSLYTLRVDRPGLFLELLALAVFSSTLKISLPTTRGGSSMSLSFAIALAAMLILGPAAAVLVTMASAWSQCTFRAKVRNPIHRTLFSIAAVGVSAWAAGFVFDLVRGGATDFMRGTLRPLGPATTIYFIVNTWLIAAAVANSTRESIHKVWVGNFAWSAPGYFVAAGAAALAAAVAGGGALWWGALPAVPLYLTYRSYREFVGRIEDERTQVRQLNEVQLATIQALALAIEVKDRTSQEHIRRLQIYAEGLGRAISLSEDEVRGIKTAALLHDIGNLAIPEHILGKPGALTHEEYQKVKIHPRVGADIVEAVPFPYPVAPLILAHHERWDGTGYPNGLKGDAIPIGARVLAVVDFFTALLFERPYRPARTYAEAVELLRDNAGTTLDPAMVARFLEILPALEKQVESGGAGISPGLGPASHVVTLPGNSALADIAGAHREAQVLYEIAQVLGTTLGLEETLSLISNNLQRLLPFDCCALFLSDPATGAYRCRHAVGTMTGPVRRLGAASLGELGRLVPAEEDESGGRTVLPAVVACPLVVGERTFGLFAVYHHDAAAYGTDHRRLLEMVAQQASLVFHNSLLFEQTQEASLTDALTGLANRRAVRRELDRELTRAERQDSEFSLMLLDLDGLKDLNDTFGHHVGDRALATVARVLRAHLRPYDLCARYAGDEFVVVLWECDARQAEDRRRELQDAVCAATVDAGQGRSVPLAISIGAATYPADGRTEDDLVAVADARMYRDKTARKRHGAGSSPRTATSPDQPLSIM